MTTLNKALVLGAILTAIAASTAFADGATDKGANALRGNQTGTVCTYQNNGDNNCFGTQANNGKTGQGRGFCGGNR